MGNRKLPFGYCIELGQVVEHPQESEIVRHIFARYLAGAAFNTLAEELRQQSVHYYEGKPWNKNMVARILADERYASSKEYPKLIESDTLEAALNLRSTRQVTIRQTPAQKVLRQLSGRTPTETMERQTLAILNRLIGDPTQVHTQPTSQPARSAELRQELDSILTQLPLDESQAIALAFQCVATQYEEIDPSEYETQRIRQLFASTEPAQELDPSLLREVISQIQVIGGKTVCLRLKNQQYIQGE